MKSNLLVSFLVELLNRLKTKKPKFFVYWQWIVGALGAVTGLPDFLSLFSIHLPTALNTFENKFVAACSVGFFMASQLTSASKIATVTSDGAILKQTDEQKLPFTATAECKKAEKDQAPTTPATLSEIQDTTNNKS